MPQQLKFSIEFKSFNNFESGPPKGHTCEVWLELVKWFRRGSLKLKVNDRQKDQNRNQKDRQNLFSVQIYT